MHGHSAVFPHVRVTAKIKRIDDGDHHNQHVEQDLPAFACTKIPFAVSICFHCQSLPWLRNAAFTAMANCLMNSRGLGKGIGLTTQGKGNE